jgi:outer membrane receptor protein involved in Fe transport
VSYELGEKALLLDRRLTVNASIYYEDWRHIQLEAYPNDWALNINGNYAHIYGADLDLLADLGAGFEFEVAAGYLYEWLDGGRAGERDHRAQLFQAAERHIYIHGSIGEFIHRPALLDLLLQSL